MEKFIMMMLNKNISERENGEGEEFMCTRNDTRPFCPYL